MAGRTLGAATVASCQGLLVLILCLIAGFRPHSWYAIPVAVLYILLIATVFAALGTAFGSTLKDMQGFQVIMNFLVMPIFFLSGALYPLENLGGIMTIVTRVDPLTYGIDGLRGALIQQWHFQPQTSIAALASVGIFFLVLGAWLFSKIEA
jgi:ABC-2 type transport system permease protein